MQQSQSTGRLQGSGPLEGSGLLQGSKPLSAKPEPLKRKEFSYPEKVPPLPVAIPRASEPAYRRPWQKPHAFALAHGEDGASIWFGCLVASITTELDDSNDDAGLTIIAEPQTIEPSNLDTNHLLQTHLGWYGDVWLYWEVTKGGSGSGSEVEGWNVTLCEVRGPGRPATTPVTLGGSSEPTTGSYCVKLGTVNEDDPVDQIISSDVFWSAAFILDNIGSFSMPSESSASSGPSEPSTEKSSNAIVPTPLSKTKYAALATVESNEVLFEFCATVKLASTEDVFIIPPIWLDVCEPGSMKVFAACGDKPWPIGVTVDGHRATVKSLPFLRPDVVNFKLTGVRKGFAGWDMPERTRSQFLQNEQSLKAMYERGGNQK